MELAIYRSISRRCTVLVQAVRLLLDANPNGATSLGPYHELPYHLAMEYGAPAATCRLLLDAHPDAKQRRDDGGSTPQQIAHSGAQPHRRAGGRYGSHATGRPLPLSAGETAPHARQVVTSVCQRVRSPSPMASSQLSGSACHQALLRTRRRAASSVRRRWGARVG